MKQERPIIFNTEMVNAIVRGRKTQTRRVVKKTTNKNEPNKDFAIPFESGTCYKDCPYGKPGDYLYVRETWYNPYYQSHYSKQTLKKRAEHTLYKANVNRNFNNFNWRPSIHMPKLFARIWLEITDVRVERIQNISESDCYVEGVKNTKGCSPRFPFGQLWDSINKDKGYGWEENPWVWVVEFKKIDKKGD